MQQAISSLLFLVLFVLSFVLFLNYCSLFLFSEKELPSVQLLPLKDQSSERGLLSTVYSSSCFLLIFPLSAPWELGSEWSDHLCLEGNPSHAWAIKRTDCFLLSAAPSSVQFVQPNGVIMPGPSFPKHKTLSFLHFRECHFFPWWHLWEAPVFQPGYLPLSVRTLYWEGYSSPDSCWQLLSWNAACRQFCPRLQQGHGMFLQNTVTAL